MATTFTGGEWSVDKIVSNEGTRYYVTSTHQHTSTFGTICDFYCRDGSGKFFAFPDGEANAHLVAAAPDLFEACKALPTFDLDNPDASDFKDNAEAFMTAMRLAQAAMAKAEKYKTPKEE